MNKQALKKIILETIEEIINEPKRKEPKTLSKLGVQEGSGLENIIAVYNEATPEEKDYWGNWYHHANKDVSDLVTKYQSQLSSFEDPIKVMCGIVAVLSPGNKWVGNIKAAEKVMEGALKINAYPRQIARANLIKETGDLDYVTGPKVTVFFNSLYDPDSVKEHMVLDGHAINIWRGHKKNLKGLQSPSKKEREQMLEDYKKASGILGVPVQAIQATTWYIWKYSSNDMPQAPLVTNPEAL
jgi:hypothetical protein